MSEGRRVATGEIFVTSGFPEFTYVEPKFYPRLYGALAQPAGGVVLEGPSGIGKSVAVQKAIEDLQKAGDSRKVVVLSSRDETERQQIATIPRERPEGFWVIEDFHALDPGLRDAFGEAIKYLADQRDTKCKLVLVGINNIGEALVRRAPDLQNRITITPTERNPDTSVEKLVSLGELWLNIRFGDKDGIVREARGSFLLAQLLCARACEMVGLTIEVPPTEPPKTLDISVDKVVEAVLADLDPQFSEVIRRFARGSKPKRAGRAPYLQCLRWLAESEQWSVNLEMAADREPRYKGSVTQILKKRFLQEHIASDPETHRLFHLDETFNFLSVHDPRLAFYLRHIRWTDFRLKIGFGPESGNVYDFALSFAAPQRPIARALYDALTDSGFEVFLDEVERDRMLGQNIREYLAPIYSTKAQFVLVVLGREYPKRYWTAFEQDQYHDRIPRGSVIPVWVAGDEPRFWSELTDRAGVSFSETPPTDAELEVAADDLGKLLARAIEEQLELPIDQLRSQGAAERDE